MSSSAADEHRARRRRPACRPASRSRTSAASGPKASSTTSAYGRRSCDASRSPVGLGDHPRELADDVLVQPPASRICVAHGSSSPRGDRRLGEVVDDEHAARPARARSRSRPAAAAGTSAGRRRGRRRATARRPRRTSSRQSQRGSGSSCTWWRMPTSRSPSQRRQRVGHVRRREVDPADDAARSGHVAAAVASRSGVSSGTVTVWTTTVSIDAAARRPRGPRPRTSGAAAPARDRRSTAGRGPRDPTGGGGRQRETSNVRRSILA